MSKLGTKRGRDTVEFWADPTALEEYTNALNNLAEVQDAEKRDPRESGSKVPAAQRKVKEIAKKAEADVAVFVIQAIPRGRYAEIQAEHPAGEDTDIAPEAVDAVLSEPDAILSVTNKASGEAIDFTAADWADESAEMSHGQWEPFARAVLLLNEGNPTPNFSWAASLGTKSSATK